MLSLPSRERGLKCINPKRMIQNMSVAPLAGAWIEITIQMRPLGTEKRSLPSRERGLKSLYSSILRVLM